MSEPLTAEEIEDIRRIHVEDTSGECCAADENYWPCDSARLLATLDAARERQGLDVERLEAVLYDIDHGPAIGGSYHRMAETIIANLAEAQQREGAGLGVADAVRILQSGERRVLDSVGYHGPERRAQQREGAGE